MREDDEPAEGGFTLKEAFLEFSAPETLQALRVAEAASGAQNRIVLSGSQEERAKRAVRRARQAAAREFGQLFMRGIIIGWGSEASPLAQRKRIPAQAWQYLHTDFNSNILEDPENRRIYAVRVYSKEQVEESIKRATTGTLSSLNREERVSADNAPTLITPKIPIYTQVFEVWDSLPEDVRKLVAVHGGKTKIAKIISSKLPLLLPASVSREFREVLKTEGVGKNGKKAE